MVVKKAKAARGGKKLQGRNFWLVPCQMNFVTVVAPCEVPEYVQFSGFVRCRLP